MNLRESSLSKTVIHPPTERDDTDLQLTGRLPANPNAEDKVFCHRLHKEVHKVTHTLLADSRLQLPLMDTDAFGRRYSQPYRLRDLHYRSWKSLDFHYTSTSIFDLQLLHSIC